MGGAGKATRLLPQIQLPDRDNNMVSFIVKLDRQMKQLMETFNDATPPSDEEDQMTMERLSAVCNAYTKSIAPKIYPRKASTVDTALKINATKSSSGTLVKGFVSSTVVNASMTDDEFDEETELKRRNEKQAQDDARELADRLRKWEPKERHRLKSRVDFMHREEQYAITFAKQSAEMASYLSTYDDDEEEVRGRDLWFTDRDLWISRRKPIRDREEAMDLRFRARLEQQITDTLRSEKNVVRASDFKPDLLLKLKTTLKFLNPLSGPNADMELMTYTVRWELVTPSTIESKVKPLVSARIENFMGAPDTDLVDFILETILPDMQKAQDGVEYYAGQQRDVKEILSDIQEAFGESEEERDEASSLVHDVWRIVIWDTEKLHLLDGANVEGLDKDVADLEINEIL